MGLHLFQAVFHILRRCQNKGCVDHHVANHPFNDIKVCLMVISYRGLDYWRLGEWETGRLREWESGRVGDGETEGMGN